LRPLRGILLAAYVMKPMSLMKQQQYYDHDVHILES
jgi:hypothetical protein